MKAPIETKVIAAAGGAGLGGAVGTFALWLLGVLFWGSPASADKATVAVASVPEPVGALIVIVVSLVGAAFAGYRAPHTPRPDLHAAPAAPVADVPAPAADVPAPADPAPVDPAPGTVA
jgi:hypothetical protein